MNILILGNGFDLAHKLPTSYMDFLSFVKQVQDVIKQGPFENKDMEITIENRNGIISQTVTINYDEWSRLISDNIWINYFMKNSTYLKHNWIDFETEISNVIQVIDEARHLRLEKEDIDLVNIKMHMLTDIITSKLKEQKYDRCINGVFKELDTMEGFISDLIKDLNLLIGALELYLVEFVEQIDCSLVSPDIKEIMVKFNKEKTAVTLCKIISFNYTHTFKKFYGHDNKFMYDYVHGEALAERSIEDNNMVLGIDEYLTDEKKDKEIEFISFKKFFQRIHKHTGCDYKLWLDAIRKDTKDHSKDNMHCLYVFGHSLDVTDRDVLRDLILNDNVMTTVFYRNKEQYGQQIANLVKVIGQDELIKRTGGSTKTIEFKLQQDMVSA